MRAFYLTCFTLFGFGLTTPTVTAQMLKCPPDESDCSTKVILFDNGVSGINAWLSAILSDNSTRPEPTDEIDLQKSGRVPGVHGTLVRSAVAVLAGTEAIRAGRFTEVEIHREGERRRISFRRPEAGRLPSVVK